MFPLGLGKRAEKIMKMFAWDAHKLSRQVMYFEDILHKSNTYKSLLDVLESNASLPYHVKLELVTLSFSSAQQSKVKDHCHSISWHRYRA